ncbi:FAD/NAD(P)-binding domain-containing protein [Stipitochalara longipes BDJ]|nr:FAD/NAD(P)-binding domain-containing protein [Stipitochalara longipes BDJ]
MALSPKARSGPTGWIMRRSMADAAVFRTSLLGSPVLVGLTQTEWTQILNSSKNHEHFPSSVVMGTFKVIIVGGGICGLTLANCLQHANIDFVVLESRDKIGLHPGAGVSIEPPGARILDQLGVYADLEKHLCGNQDTVLRDSEGRMFLTSNSRTIRFLRTGYKAWILRRKVLLEALLDKIWDREKVLVNKRIESICYESEKGVVTCQDGTKYYGDIIVGCDGVNSMVRKEMWRISDSEEIGDPLNADRNFLAAEYRGLYGISTPIDGLNPATLTFVVSQDECCYWMVGKDGTVVWALVEKLDKLYRPPNIPRYGKEEAQAFAERRLEMILLSDTAHIKFGDLWEKTTFSALLAVEEGFLEQWSSGRIVCIGDSVHKITPEGATGTSLAIESAASLANHLKSLVDNCVTTKPTPAQIEQSLADFQSSRYARAKAMTMKARLNVRLFTLQTSLLKFLCQYWFPISGDTSANGWSDSDIGAERLEFLPLPARSLTGTMPFNPMQGITKQESRKERAWVALPLLVLAVVSAYIKVEESSSSFVEALLPMYLLMMMEGSRRANEMKPVQLTLLFSTLSSFFGAEIWINVWLFVHYLWSPIEVFAALDQRMLKTNYAITLLPTVLFISAFFPRLSNSALGSALPGLPNLFHRLFSSFVRDSMPYNRFYNTKADLSWIRSAVGFMCFISAGLFQYQRFDAPSGLLDQSLRSMSIENVFYWMTNNSVCMGSIFWELLLYKDLKEAGMVQIGWVPLFGIGSLVLGLVGPGATIVGYDLDDDDDDDDDAYDLRNDGHASAIWYGLLLIPEENGLSRRVGVAEIPNTGNPADRGWDLRDITIN